MKTTLKILITTLSFAVASGIVAHDREHGDRKHPKDHGKFLEKMAKDLGLTADQKKRIEKVHSDSKQAKEDYENKQDALRKELHALLSADNLDKSAIRSKMEEVSKVKIDSKMLWIDDRIKINEILTPEQRAKQKEIFKKHHEEHGNKEHKKDRPEKEKRDKKRD
ncbi:Spy/CpxP family protein refolding chaperone [Leptospira idonii]|nr:Spy/CpxP family protein refolding chaperone [Leptospira idonii]